MSSTTPLQTEAGTIALALAICDTLIDAKSVQLDDLLKSIAGAQVTLQGQHLDDAAALVGKVYAALRDPSASVQRRHVVLNLGK